VYCGDIEGLFYLMTAAFQQSLQLLEELKLKDLESFKTLNSFLNGGNSDTVNENDRTSFVHARPKVAEEFIKAENLQDWLLSLTKYLDECSIRAETLPTLPQMAPGRVALQISRS
jgi:glutamine synthetase adenylyltransferase